MEKLNINKGRLGLSLRVPILFIALGCLMFTNLFFTGDRWKKIVFGAILILYGLFRIYKARKKIRNMT